MVIQPNSQVSFTVTCTPKQVQTYQASLQLTVTDNQFEDTLIQMIGEGYMEDVTIENLHSLSSGLADSDEDVVADEDVSALKSNSISFGDVYVNDKKQLLFTMRNLSKTDCFRFEWPANLASASFSLNSTNQSTEQPGFSNSSGPQLVSFSPRVGHLHAGCAKDVKVTFKSNEPKTLKKELFNCMLTKISFDMPINEVKDWDDRMTMVKWINEVVQGSSNAPVSNSITNNSNSNVHQAAGGVSSSLNEASTIFTQRQMSEANIAAAFHANQHTNVSQLSNKQIVRKKVVETESEPKHTKSDENVQPIDLFISANCDYSRYRCKTSVIRFKETLMFQTRVYEVSIINRGIKNYLLFKSEGS